MKRKKTSLLLITSLTFTLLASCSKEETNKWSYTKEDMSDFITIQANLENKGDNIYSFNADTDVTIFTDELDKDDVIVYDVDKAVKLIEENGKGYADYATLKAASIPVNSIETLADKDGFNVTFSSADSSNYGMLVHSSVTSANEYVMVTKRQENNTISKDPQAEFEEKYVSSQLSWEDGGKFIMQMFSNIAMIVVGVGTENPTAIVSGIFGVFSALAENFTSSSPTIQDVMNQLKEMDRKIDELGAKLEKNTQQLADEIVRTEALVDQTNLNTLNLAINDFATNCISPINVFNRDLADHAGTYYRDFVNSSQTVNLVLSKNAKGEITSTPLADLGDAPSYNFSLNIGDFSNAKAHLSKHNNIVENGFMAELDKDIDAALAKKSDLPEGASKENLRSFVTAMIYEQFMKKYFSSNKEKAQNYGNYVIELAERITGASGKISILNTYLSRLQCMYNFCGEIKATVRTLSANLLQILDMNTARAAEARLFAGYSTSELEKNYKSAREAIQKFYKSITDTADTYSFTTSAILSGGFYQSEYAASYSNPGNKCKLDVAFNVDKIEMNGVNVSRTKDDMSKHASISAMQHSRIVTRWNLLRSSGAVDSKYDYIHYLSNSNIISSSSIQAAETLVSLKKASSSSYRILTNDRTERELNNSDTGMVLNCVAKGNPGGDYFEVGKNYNFRGKNSASSWYGKTFEGTFVDAASGMNLGTQKIASWARYAESHWYWNNDEYWAFTNNNADNYFFTIDIATQK